MTCSVPTPRPELKSRVFTLHWDAATDPVTPSAGIGYEIFYSATPGGENYSTPLVSTPSGTTTYSVSVAAAGAAYFVVRARDQAGLEDQNTAERQGVSVCG
jgi:streptogramin lyase